MPAVREDAGLLARFEWCAAALDAALADGPLDLQAPLDACLRDVEAMQPRIVGFSCLFQQIVPSLALARRIKAVAPETFIVFGGNECYGVKAVETVSAMDLIMGAAENDAAEQSGADSEHDGEDPASA